MAFFIYIQKPDSMILFSWKPKFGMSPATTESVVRSIHCLLTTVEYNYPFKPGPFTQTSPILWSRRSLLTRYVVSHFSTKNIKNWSLLAENNPIVSKWQQDQVKSTPPKKLSHIFAFWSCTIHKTFSVKNRRKKRSLKNPLELNLVPLLWAIHNQEFFWLEKEGLI